MAPKISPELQSEVQQQHGGPVWVQADQGAYVLMSVERYRELMGVGGDADFAESVAAVQTGLADLAAGRVRPLTDVLDELAPCRVLNRLA